MSIALQTKHRLDDSNKRFEVMGGSLPPHLRLPDVGMFQPAPEALMEWLEHEVERVFHTVIAPVLLANPGSSASLRLLLPDADVVLLHLTPLFLTRGLPVALDAILKLRCPGLENVEAGRWLEEIGEPMFAKLVALL